MRYQIWGLVVEPMSYSEYFQLLKESLRLNGRFESHSNIHFWLCGPFANSSWTLEIVLNQREIKQNLKLLRSKTPHSGLVCLYMGLQ